MNNNVLEMIIFQISPEVTKEQFLEKYHRLNKVLKKDFKGFIKRTVTKDKSQDKWVEMVWWDSIEIAQSALEKLSNIPEFQEYCSVLLEDGMKMFYLEEVA